MIHILASWATQITQYQEPRGFSSLDRRQMHPGYAQPSISYQGMQSGSRPIPRTRVSAPAPVFFRLDVGTGIFTRQYE